MFILPSTWETILTAQVADVRPVAPPPPSLTQPSALEVHPPALRARRRASWCWTRCRSSRLRRRSRCRRSCPRQDCGEPWSASCAPCPSMSTDGLRGNLVTFPSHPVLDTDFTSGSSSGSVRVEEANHADAQPASTSGSERRTSLHEKDEEVDVPPSSTTGSETASVHETEEEERDLLPDQPSPESPRRGSPSPRGLSKTEVWRSTCYSLRQRKSGGLRAWARCPRAAS